MSENQSPGAGAAFWAARGVRIEPEPTDAEPGEAVDEDVDEGFVDDVIGLVDEDGDPVDRSLGSSDDDPDDDPDSSADDGSDGSPDEADDVESFETVGAPEAGFGIPAQAEAPQDAAAPGLPAQTRQAHPAADGDADGHDGDAAWPETGWSPGQWSADQDVAEGADEDSAGHGSPGADVARSIDVESDDDTAGSSDPDRVRADGFRLPRQTGVAQTSLDEVEPQPGAVVDGLSALNETISESRRAKAAADRLRAEPAWQLTDSELSAALPPLETCLEAILMVVDEPVAVVMLAQVVERPTLEVEAALRTLSEQYTAERRGFDLREVGTGEGDRTGWRIYTRSECAPVVERFVRDGQQARLTQAALETLAVVAYRQPVSRSKISAIRGVNCDGVMRTLLARGLVEECGTEYETGALLYRTTGYFLERMGLMGLDELPELAPLLPSAADIEDES